MLKKTKEAFQTVEIVNMEDIIPKDHILRKIDAAVDFDIIYEFVDNLYSKENGRPSIDPVVLFKMVLIQHLFGIRSLRQTAAEVELNVAYRWFIGYSLNKKTPHFSTISYNFLHRFTEETIGQIFEWILTEIEKAGYLSPEVVFVDGTHIKANANTKKNIKKAIPQAAKTYEKQLMEEINEDRKSRNKKPFDDPPDKPVKEKTITQSKTDPESGLFHKGEHKKCFAYSAQTVCDGHNYVLGVTVNPGNMHDSSAFDGLYEQVIQRFPQIEVITADAAYKTPWICKRIIDDNRKPSLPYKRPMTKKGNHEWYKYVYDEYYDCVICPEFETLEYATTNRDGYRIYKSDPNKCRNCPSRSRCTESKNCQKIVAIHIWHDYIEQAEDIRHSQLGKDTYSKRSETIERVFADAKEKHSMRYTPYRGIKQVTSWVKLKYAAMNLKKFAIRKWSDIYGSFLDFILHRFSPLKLFLKTNYPIFGW